MRLLLRTAGLALAAGSLSFFLSCERHHIGELPEEQEAMRTTDANTTVPHASPSPAFRGTPANFFPDKPKP